MSFKPNDLELEDVDDLEPWQLLVSACHFADNMTDCVSLDYDYFVGSDGHIRISNLSTSIDIDEDISMERPIESLESYAQFDWKEWCKERIKNWIEENK